MKRPEVIKRIEELGYERYRSAKHGDMYQHRVTGNTIEISLSPSDPNWHHVALKEAERKAVTNGSGHLRLAEAACGASTLLEAAEAVLRSSGVPMRAEEIADAALKGVGRGARSSVSTMLAKAAGDHPTIVKLQRGWYVYDPELAVLPPLARESAIGVLRDNGPRRAYREPSIRKGALEFGRSLIPGEDVPESAALEQPRQQPQPQGGELPPIFELLAEEPDGTLAVLRGEDGRLWLARPLATFGAEGGEGS